jgi:carbonic anhydrase/acetyltransferase-like protein (isoleucine patch superfamily)
MMMKADPVRVARRHTAGLFEPPPRVLKAVVDWATSAYAGHVLARVEKILGNTPDDTEKRRAETQRYLADNGGEIRTQMYKMRPGGRILRIPAGKKTDVVVKLADPSDAEPGFQVVEVKKGGRAKFPREPTNYDSPKYDDLYYDYIYSLMRDDQALDEIKGALARGLMTYPALAQEQNMRTTWGKKDPEYLVELELLRRECMRYTNRAKAYKSQARTTLPIDLMGWKYLDGMSASEIEQRQNETQFTEFSCTLNFVPHKTRGGQWSSRKLAMQLDLWRGMADARTVADFRKGIQRVRDISRHETIHLGQTALKKVKDLGPWRAGYPAFDTHEEKGKSEYIGGKRLPHPRRSVEFYTRLADEVSRFSLEVRRVPLPKRRGFLRNWMKTRKFFVENQRNPGKWRKMTSEFVSEIEKAGIRIPQMARMSETANVNDTATIGPDTFILGSPKILDNAKVLGSATIKDRAEILDEATVKDNAVVGGFVQVADSAVIKGDAVLTGDGSVAWQATMSDKARLSGSAVVEGSAQISGSASIEGSARMEGRAHVYGDAVIKDNAVVRGQASVTGGVVGGSTIIEGRANVYGGVWDGEHVFDGNWKAPPKPPPMIDDGTVLWFNPRRPLRHKAQWAVVGEFLGKGKVQPSPRGVLRAPNRYAVWVPNKAEDRMVFIGDWDDFDLDPNRPLFGSKRDLLERLWKGS